MEPLAWHRECFGVVAFRTRALKAGRAATVLAALPRCGRNHPVHPSSMKASKKSSAKNELVGIVISGTQPPPATTVFTAYVWGPAPVASDEDSKKG